MASLKRQERFKALMRNIISSFIRLQVGLGVMVTVTRVETSGDLRTVKVFISVFPEEKEKEVLELLKKKSPELHNHLKEELKIKFLPKISFEIDKGLKLEREIEEILGQVAK